MILQIFSLVIGILGLGYGVYTLMNEKIEVYSPSKKEVVEYHGKAARIVSTGIFVGGFGLLMVGIVGWSMWPLITVVAVAYYGSLYLANQIKD